MSRTNNDDGWGITCQCGHFDCYDRFEMPESDNHYQCPKCGKEWSINFRILADKSFFSFVASNDNS